MTGINRTNPPQQWSSSSDLLFIQFNEGLVQLWRFEWNDQLMKICSNSYFWTKRIVKMADEFLCTWHISALLDRFFVSIFCNVRSLWSPKVSKILDFTLFIKDHAPPRHEDCWPPSEQRGRCNREFPAARSEAEGGVLPLSPTATKKEESCLF